TQLQKAKGATERIIVTLSEEEEDLHVGNELKQPFQDISFQNVSFAYKAGWPVLHGVTFTAPPGEITAIVGPSGGGKTTLFSLLERYYTPTERKIVTLSEEEEDLHVGNELKQPFQDISFQNVSFAYKAGWPVLHGVTFTAPPGEITAIVGPSGGGKTTLFSLLERYYTPTEG